MRPYMKISVEAELRDAWEGQGNSRRITFLQWVREMADNPRGTLQDSARMFLVARRKAMKRHAGHCWSCATNSMVRTRVLWMSGTNRLLCKDCERQLEKTLCRIGAEVSR